MMEFALANKTMEEKQLAIRASLLLGNTRSYKRPCNSGHSHTSMDPEMRPSSLVEVSENQKNHNNPHNKHLLL
jgi:hypothetical protein